MKKHKLELKWAFIFCAMSLLWMLAERLAGLHDVNIAAHAMYSNFVAIPAIIIYFLALREKRSIDFHGYMTFRQGFISGLFLSLFVAVLSPIVQVITFKIITPYYFENAIKYAVAHNLMTIDAALANFNLNAYMLQAFLGALFMGIVTSAIVALFTASKKLPQAL